MTPRHRIVIVDDEPNIGLSLRLILEREGYGVTVFETASAFRAERRAGRADLYVIDVRLPDASGIDVLREIRQHGDPASVIMISGHGTIPDAIEATRRGAFDFLEKPLARERVLLSPRRSRSRT
jgi:two-component system nitrogen regulation response regulator NtrX